MRFPREWEPISPGRWIDAHRLKPYPRTVKPEEWRLYEEMYAAMRVALNTSWLVFEIAPDGLGDKPPSFPSGNQAPAAGPPGQGDPARPDRPEAGPSP